MSASVSALSSKAEVSGYLVVLKAAERDRIVCSSTLYHTPRKRPYHGFTREPCWRISDLAYGEHETSRRRQIARDFMEEVTDSGIGLAVFESPMAALSLYEECVGGISAEEEIIAVGSNAISAAFTHAKAQPDASLVFQGYDIWVPGEWSLIDCGYCLEPELFRSVEWTLNNANLLESLSHLSLYLDVYESLQVEEQVEPCGDGWREQVEPVAVWRWLSDV